MNVSFSTRVDTTMSLDKKNSTDPRSADEFADYISQQLFDNNLSVMLPIQTKTLGKLVFEIKIRDNICMDSQFRCEIYAIAKVDTDNNSNEIWNSLYEEAPTFIKYLVDGFVRFISSMNKSISIMCPNSESYLFRKNKFFIEMDPLEPYTPEFTKFAMNDEIDEDDLIGNLLVD